MPLSKELITQNLPDLKEDQILKLVDLSANAEIETVNTKIGEHHGRIEKDVLTVSGVEKQQGEKSYEYLKRVLSDFKEKSGAGNKLAQEIETYKAKVSELEESLKGQKGNETLAQKLKDTESQLSALQSQYQEEKTGFTKKLQDYKVNTELGRVNLKFKSAYPESVQKTLLQSAKAEVLSTYKPDFVEDQLVFRNEAGEIARNKANGLNPYTAEELLKERLAEVLDTGKQTTGAGTNGGAEPQPGRVDVASLSTAKTQIEADEIITKHLLQEGFVRTSPEFAQKQKEIRTESGVPKLPLR